jgi:hypothetical protein
VPELSIFSGELDERLTIRVVDATDRRKLEPRERSQIGKVRAVEVEVMNRARNENDKCQRGDEDEKRAGKKTNATTDPA